MKRKKTCQITHQELFGPIWSAGDGEGSVCLMLCGVLAVVV